jgi:two-component system, chemotaxis family, protein-glutamate methylesterase/glutaminase
MSKIKVLIVDDSAVVRQVLTQILCTDPQIEVIGAAADPYLAANKIRDEIPDVITLDIEMPKMDGLTFLRKIMSQHPVPIVIISSLTTKGAETTLRALEYGAVEIITKDNINTKEFFEESRERICRIIKESAGIKLKRRGFVLPTEKLSTDAVIKKAPVRSMIQTTEKVIAIGASTGGTEALKLFLEALPPDCPGIVIVQHMPEVFTKSFANRLNQICKVTVKEAENGDSVIRGRALIAPGNKHMLLKRSGARYYVEIQEGPLVNRHRPSVDVLFRSTAQYAGKNSIGIIMTGMGDDGARGLLEMKQSGARTIAQDEKSCIVFGMPKEAIKLEAVDHILPLEKIAPYILEKS